MSSELQMLVDVATRIFEDHDAAERTDDIWDARLWKALEATGLSDVTNVVAPDGSAGNLRESAEIIRVAGRFAASVPLAETYLSAPLLSRFELPIPPGPLTIGVSSDLDIKRFGNAWKVSGRILRVPWARVAGGIVAIGSVEGEDVILTILPQDCEVVAGRNVAGEPRDDVVIDIKLEADRIVTVGPGTSRAIQLRAALYKVALMTGAAERAFELSLKYVSERFQFGRAIGSFQVVQHQIAEMAGEVLALRTAYDAAVECCATAAPLSWTAQLAVASAKAQAGRSATFVARTSHQLHGAIGFTYEHSLRLSTTRLWAWREECGSETYWVNQVGSYLLGAEDGLWATLVGIDDRDVPSNDGVDRNLKAGVKSGN